MQEQKVRRFRDGLGLSMDEEIIETVTGCLAHECNTHASCGGHPEKLKPRFPWVDIIGFDEPEEMFLGEKDLKARIVQQFHLSDPRDIFGHEEAERVFYDELEQPSHERTAEWNAWARRGIEAARRMNALLHEFAQEYPQDRCVLGFDPKSTPGNYRVTCFFLPEIEQASRTREDEVQLVHEAQEVMQAFGRFLKRRFVQNG